MALFQSDAKDILKRLANKEFASPEERDEMLARLATMPDLRARDVVWMLFRPDRALRDSGAKVLQRLRDPEMLSSFLTEAKGKPEASFRAAAAVFFAAPPPGVDTELPKLLTIAPKESKDAAEIRDLAQRLILEAPLTPATETLLWQMASTGPVVQRVAVLSRLGSQEKPDPKTIARWQKLAQDNEQAIREKALEVLATRAPSTSIPLFVEQLPRVGYSAQQILIDGLTRVAAGQPPEFADALLPLVASGDAGTRTAVIKILLSMQNSSAVVKRYIRFTTTLAGFVRDRVLDSLRAFGDHLIEPAIEMLQDPDENVRTAALAVVGTSDDPRLVPATIALLKDPDWWVRIAAAETLGRSKDPGAVDPLIGALGDADVKWAAVEALGRIGDARALPALGRMLADPEPNVRIEVMQALRHFNHPQVVPALTKIATSDPERPVRMRANDLIEEIQRRDRGGEQGEVRSQAMTAQSVEGEPKLHSYLISTRNSGASDFHLSVGQPPIVRLSASLLRAQGDPLTAGQTEAMLREILTDEQWARLATDQQLDFCYYIPQAGRYRGNVFLDHRGYNAVFRVIPEKPPTIHELGLPAHLEEIADYHQGLVIICGPSGSGKSTTLAAFVNLFNDTRNHHVLTMEDPVEFVHPFKNCLINQREVGTHTESFARALRAALREDPDVIVIGELRDNQSVSLALTAAETGHIVLGTLNSTSAPKALDRLISSFPFDEQPQIRASLSESLKYVIAQRLLPAKEARAQVACFEILKGTSNVANMIRDEKTFQIHSAMQIGRSQGMQTLDEGLKDLLKRNRITAETAYMAATKKEEFEAFVSPDFLRSAKG